MSLFPLAHDWAKARADAGMHTGSHEDMHAGELETSLLLHVAPHLVRPGNHTADWTADDGSHTTHNQPYCTTSIHTWD